MALRSITRFSRIARVGSLPVTQFRYPVQFEVKSCSTLRLNSTLTTGDPEQSTSPNESGQDMECLKVEMQQLVEKYASLEDKYKRALAESENTRKRLLKQIDDAKLFGIQSFCKDLLEVADILTAATESSPQDQLQKGVNPAFANLYNGLKMTETQLFKVFARHSLVPISPKVGEVFDPHFHEAVFQAPLEAGKEKNTVAVVTKVGYMLHGRTLRPAFVGVFGS